MGTGHHEDCMCSACIEDANRENGNKSASVTGSSCPVCTWQGEPREERDNSGLPLGSNFVGPIIGYGCPSCGVKFSHVLAWGRAR